MGPGPAGSSVEGRALSRRPRSTRRLIRRRQTLHRPGPCPAGWAQVDMKDRWRNLLRKETGVVNYYTDVHRRQELSDPRSEVVRELMRVVEVDKARDLSSQPPETPGEAEK